MPFISSLQVSPVDAAAGAARNITIVAQVDPAIVAACDIDEDDIDISYEIRRTATGVLVGSGELVAVPNMTDDCVFAVTHVIALADATAGGYAVKVFITEDVDLGDSATEEAKAQFGTEIDSDDIPARVSGFALGV